MKTSPSKPPDDGKRYIYRPYITTKDGTVIWAKWYGKRAFRIPIGPGTDH